METSLPSQFISNLQCTFNVTVSQSRLNCAHWYNRVQVMHRRPAAPPKPKYPRTSKCYHITPQRDNIDVGIIIENNASAMVKVAAVAKNLGSGKYCLTWRRARFGCSINSRHGMTALPTLPLSHFVAVFLSWSEML